MLYFELPALLFLYENVFVFDFKAVFCFKIEIAYYDKWVISKESLPTPLQSCLLGKYKPFAKEISLQA